MKKSILKILILFFVVFAPILTVAEVRVHVNIPLPPPIIFPMPPSLVVIPETNVYVVPDVQDEIFFYDGWWWRPWQGRWYRSHYHDREWVVYPHPPHFYRSVPSGWRNDYANHHWKGYRWDYKPVPHHEIQRNWVSWKKEKHWEKQTWGVQGLRHKHPGKHHKEVHKSKKVIRYRE